MSSQRIAGTLFLAVNGETQNAKGDFSYNLGHPKRTAIMGPDGVHGYKEEPQVPMIEGAVTDRGNLDVKALVTGDDVTVTLELANGKVISMTNGWYAGEGTVGTAEAEIAVRWEARKPLQEIS